MSRVKATVKRAADNKWQLVYGGVTHGPYDKRDEARAVLKDLRAKESAEPEPTEQEAPRPKKAPDGEVFVLKSLDGKGWLRRYQAVSPGEIALFDVVEHLGDARTYRTYTWAERALKRIAKLFPHLKAEVQVVTLEEVQASRDREDKQGVFALACTEDGKEGWLRRDQAKAAGDVAPYRHVTNVNKARIYRTMKWAEKAKAHVEVLYPNRVITIVPVEVEW